MTQGTIKWYSEKKGYGFIEQDNDGPDLFVHHSEIEMPEKKPLKEGDRITFEIREGLKGPAAINVTIA